MKTKKLDASALSKIRNVDSPEDRKNKLRFTAKSDKGAYVKSGGAGVPVAGQAGFFWRPALTADAERHMMWPFSGRGT